MPLPPFPFPLEPMDKAMVVHLGNTAPPGKYAAMHAVHHLAQAWLIREIDPAMAALRSITAEEEAASALFHALRSRKYSHANALDTRSHVLKLSVLPYVASVQSVVAEAFGSNLGFSPRFFPPVSTQRARMEVHFTDRRNGRVFRYDPPLEFTFKAATDDPIEFSDLAKARFINRLSSSSTKGISSALLRKARARNGLLYASKQGMPGVAITEEQLRKYHRRVFRLFQLYYLVAPYRARQSFVQQCLSGFLAGTKPLLKGSARLFA